jgi:hypothetical protein
MRTRQLAPSTGGGGGAGREAIEGIESTTLEPRYTVQEKTVRDGDGVILFTYEDR